jgi:hypothetical protein
MKRGLIVFYSRTGYTASLAKELAGMSGWDLMEIKDRHPRDGFWGQLRCALDVLLHRRPAIQAYDRHRGHFAAVAHVCTYGGRGAEQAARQAAELADAPLVASLAVTSYELEQGDYRKRLDEFLKKLHAFEITP